MTGPTPYTAKAHAGGGREGRAHCDGDNIWFAMALPKEMGGHGLGSNPEQMFALGYATCFNSAVLFIAGQKKIDASKAKVTCEVTIAKDDTSFGLSAKLTLAVPGLDPAQTKELIEAAHQICPYSKATRNNISVELAVA